MLMVIVFCMTALLVAVPVAAQQTAPQTPAPSDDADAQEHSAGPKGVPGAQGGANDEAPASMGKVPAQGPVRVRMTERPGMGNAGDEDDDDIRADRMRGWRRGSGRRVPMQVIINIGPDNRVDVEEQGAGRAGIDPMRAHMMMQSKVHDHATADGMAARLDYLRSELRLTLEQQPAWNRFASTVLAGVVRDAVVRMRPTSDGAGQGQSPLEHRLAMHETMLTARLEAVRVVRGALPDLAAALNDAQRRTLDEHADAFVPGVSQVQAGRH